MPNQLSGRFERMSVIYYFHFHPSDDFRETIEVSSNAPIPYDYAGNGYFSDRIYHSRNSDARFYVVTFGYEKGWARQIKPRITNRYMFHFIFDGKGKFNSDEVKRGDIYILPPNKKHVISHDERNPMTLGWIALSGKELELMLNILHLPNETTITLSEDQINRIEKIFLDTVYQPHPEEEMPFFLLGNFFIVLSHSKIFYDSSPSNDNIFVDHALSYINTHYDQEISVNDIAEFLHLSVSRLRSLFQQKLGYSPQEAIIQKRMVTAKALLLSENPPNFQTLSSMCGYADQSAFSRRFKKEFGESPSEYLEKHK